MLSLINSKLFLVGFLAGLLVFIVANIYSAYPGYRNGINKNGVALTEEFDGYAETGWPFRFHRSGTILHLDEVLWPGLVADIVITLGISIGVGALFHSLFTQSRRRNIQRIN